MVMGILFTKVWMKRNIHPAPPQEGILSRRVRLEVPDTKVGGCYHILLSGNYRYNLPRIQGRDFKLYFERYGRDVMVTAEKVNGIWHVSEGGLISSRQFISLLKNSELVAGREELIRSDMTDGMSIFGRCRRGLLFI
jgi:hypothetical protein